MGLYERLRIKQTDIGKKFGSRTQIGASFSVRDDCGARRRFAVFECECGAVWLLSERYAKLGSAEKCHVCNNLKHGMCDVPEYHVWEGMRQRCNDPNSKSYSRYGGRGIKVCDRWLESFANFYADMGPRPSDEYEIDRYPNNDGNYEPGNCRWTTRKRNNRNRGNNTCTTYRGERMTAQDLIEQTGGNKRTILARLKKGWTGDQTADTPRWQRTPLMIVAMVVALSAICAQAQQIPVGSVLCSRNLDERENRSPGWLNHLCVYVGSGQIVESMPPGGVRLITHAEYVARPYAPVWVLAPRTPELGELAAARARSLVGMPYRKASSLLPRIERKGMNCVSVVNQSYAIGTYLPKLRRPDHVTRMIAR